MEIDYNEVASDWSENLEKVSKYTFIAYEYSYENYEGMAFGVLERDNKLFIVEGSHCSCYGLEEQWEPEETPKEVVLKILQSQLTSRWTDFSDEFYLNAMVDVEALDESIT